MAKIRCPLNRRGRASREWYDGKKWRYYCLGWVDRKTDDPIPECLACTDYVSHAQEDLDDYFGRADDDE